MRHTVRALPALALLAALSVLVIGCAAGGGQQSPPPTASQSPHPAGAADITGPVEQLSRGSGGTGEFLVSADPSVSHTVDRARVRVTASTVVWAPVGEGRRQLKFADLKVGQRVSVRFSGPVAESYPVQGTAADVEVLSPL